MAKNDDTFFAIMAKNGEKMLANFAIKAKMARKSMAKMAKINGENGDFFRQSPFRHGENREKNEWRMAMSPFP